MPGNRPFLLGLVASALLPMTACSDDLPNPSDAIHEAIATDCAKAFECMSSYDPAPNGGQSFVDRYGANQAECEARLFAFLTTTYTDLLDASAAEGRIDYSSSNARTCFAAAGKRTCDQYFRQNGASYNPPPACDEVFVGTVPNGGSCTFDPDCAADGSYCNSSTKICTGP